MLTEQQWLVQSGKLRKTRILETQAIETVLLLWQSLQQGMCADSDTLLPS